MSAAQKAREKRAAGRKMWEKRMDGGRVARASAFAGSPHSDYGRTGRAGASGGSLFADGGRTSRAGVFAACPRADNGRMSRASAFAASLCAARRLQAALARP